MKKILISGQLESFFDKEKDICNRSELKIFIAPSAEAILNTHRSEHFDLMILPLDMEEGNPENICSSIRKDDDLKHVSIMIICNNTKADIDRVQKCRANSYITKPIVHEEFMQRLTQFLAIPERQDYRVVLKVTVHGKSNNDSFFCSSYNLSTSGLLIETKKVFEKNDIISCSFFLPNSDQIISDAEIMRTIRTANGSFQYGIRFMNLAHRYKTAIEKFIQRRSGKS